MAANEVKKGKPGKRARDRSVFRRVELVAPEGRCPYCGEPLDIFQWRERAFQSLSGPTWLVRKDRRCRGYKICPGPETAYRPVEEDVLLLKRREYGLDVVCFIGEGYLRDSESLPLLHKELTKERGVLISPRHMSNLLRLFLALMNCRDGDSEVVRERLREQGRLVLAIDAVRFDDVTPRLYVIRDVVSGEFLYGERIDQADTAALVECLSRVKAIGVPVVGVITDGERALATAAAQVFPEAPHQLCQVHYLGKLVSKQMESDLATLETQVREVVQQVKTLETRLKEPKPARREGTEAQTGSTGQADSADPNEQEVAQALCHVVKTVGKSRGDKLTNPAAVKRYFALIEAAEAVRQSCAQKLEGGEWPVVARLLALLLALTAWGELARRLQRQVGVVRRIAHILHSEASGRQVKRLLRTYLNRLEREAPQRGRGAPRGRFIRHVLAVSSRWWKGLFACYDHPDLPSNNNDLERFLGAIKRQQRRVHGRKSTAGGPLEGCAPSLLAAWSRIDEYPDLVAALAEIPEDKLQAVRDELQRLEAPSRRRRSIARDPNGYLRRILDRLEHA